MYSGLAASHWRRVQGGRPVARARSLSQFQASFPDETSCAAFLFERCWPEGFVCPACCNGRAASLKSRAHTYECLGCGRQTSITAGTVMHRSKLPLTVWFWAAPLMATHSNGMSALQFEAQLGITYKTAWLLAQKLRRSMIDPQREPLEGVVGSTKLKFRSAPTTGDLGTSGRTAFSTARRNCDQTRRAVDSPLEGDGFEPSVPVAREPVYIAEGELRGDRRAAKKIWRGTDVDAGQCAEFYIGHVTARRCIRLVLDKGRACLGIAGEEPRADFQSPRARRRC